MASTTFQDFLHASLIDPVKAPRQPNRLRPDVHFRQSYSGGPRSLSTMQCSELACYDLQPHDQTAHLHPDFPGNYVENHGDNSPVKVGNEHAQLPDFLQDSGSPILAGPQSTADTLFMPFRPAVGSFSSTGSASTSFHSASEDSPWQADMLRRMPNGSVLSQAVDTSKYEVVDASDWMFSSVDYEASSPSSVDTSGTGPHTPISPVPSSAMQFHQGPLSSSFDNIVPKTESIGHSDPTVMPFNGHQSYPFSQCHCMTCLAARTGTPTFAPLWHPYPAPSQSQNIYVQHPHAHGRYDDPLNPWHNLGGQQIGLPGTVEATAQPATSSLQELERLAPQPTPSTDVESGDEMDHTSNSQDETESAVRRERDQYLLSMRAQGLSYKEIKRRGRFREAESTLRGRVRVLTKDKSERVRRPEWTDNDVSPTEQLRHGLHDRQLTRIQACPPPPCRRPLHGCQSIEQW